MFRTKLFSSPLRSIRAGDCPWALTQIRTEYATLKRQREEFALKSIIEPAWKLSFRATKKHTKTTTLTLGDQRLRRVEWLLDHMLITRTDEQIAFHTSFIGQRNARVV